MADNPAPEQNNSGGGGSKVLVILGIVNMLLIGGVIFYMLVLKKDPPPQIVKNDMTKQLQDKKDDEESGSREIGELYDMKNIVVNLNEPGGNRMLKLSLSLEYKKKKLKDILKKRDAQIRNEIIIYLSSLTFVQTAGLGKKNISKTLKKKINSLLVEGKIREVYFQEFVVQ